MKRNRTALNGDLEFISLPEVFQLLGGNGSSGELRLQLDNGETGVVFMADGNPVDAARGEAKGLEALYSLLAEEKGLFEFTPKAVRRKNTVNKGRMEVILDALRIADEIRVARSRSKGALRRGDASADPPLIKGPVAGHHYVIEHEEFPDGRRIASEGKYGQWLWVVLEGTVEITKATPMGPLTLLRLGEGAIVGDITGLSLGNNVRNVTAAAVTKVHLGVLDYQRLSVEFALLSPQFKQLLLSLDGRLRQVTDLTARYYCGDTGPLSVITPRTTVLKQGEEAEGLFVILRGTASVARADKLPFVPLAFLGPGDCYGAMPFLRIGHEPDGASVAASRDFQVETMDSDRIALEYDGLSPVFKSMTAHAAHSISAITEKATALYRSAIPPGKHRGA